MAPEEPSSQLRTERTNLHPDHISYVHKQLSDARGAVESFNKFPNIGGQAQEQRARARLALVEPILGELAQGQYEGLTTLLSDDTARVQEDINYMQRQLQGKLEGDDGPNGFLELQTRRLHGSEIAAKLQAPEDKAWIAQVDTELKERQLHTERGRTLASLVTKHAEHAHLQRLQQLLPQPATKK
jgi:hypothetical protein